MNKTFSPAVRIVGWSTIVLLLLTIGFATATYLDLTQKDSKIEYINGEVIDNTSSGNISLSKGQIVTIVKDLGDQWHINWTSGTTAFRGPVSKSAIRLVSQTVFYTPVMAEITRSTAPSFAYHTVTSVLAPRQSLPSGTKVRIYAQEGDNYIFKEVGQPLYFKLPTSAFVLAAGQDLAGAEAVLSSWSDGPTLFSKIAARGFVATAALSIIFVALYFILRARTPDLEALPVDEFTQRVEKRFPSHILPRTSVRTMESFGSGDLGPFLSESRNELWANMLEMYPNPPRNEDDRQQREVEFWRRYAESMSVNDNGINSLKPKQEIIDHFRAWEKWILRDYFAATGVVIKTIIKDVNIIYGDVFYANNLTTWGEHTSLSNTRKRQAQDKANDASDRFHRETLPAHFEKWGGWFFFNISEAFNAIHDKDINYGPQSATTSPLSANDDDLAYRPHS